MVDTYLQAQEHFKTQDFKLLALARQMELPGVDDRIPGTQDLNRQDNISEMFKTTEGVVSAVSLAATKAKLSLLVAFNLDSIPLTKRLCSLAGNRWSSVLCGGRSERIEYLLMHSFHRQKIITPDGRYENQSKDRGVKHYRGFETGEPDAADGDNNTGDITAATGKGGKYKGGKVLEPKTGLYRDYVLLLDFNSLYPSIIQEFNICFTTVTRPKVIDTNPDGTPVMEDVAIPSTDVLRCADCRKNPNLNLPDGAPCRHRSVLPKVIRDLVVQRREVKAMMKREKDARVYKQLHVRQLALKLTANSMYGCLGFENSRFFARPLAELVTMQGREALTKTAELVPTINPTVSVIYGDTDSVMINTSIRDNLPEARAIAEKIKKEVNRRYRNLEIDIDGVFRTLLLHKKKKYAALVVEDYMKEGKILKPEVKGLDMVRRDWCPLSQKTCGKVVDIVLYSNQGDDITQKIMTLMADTANEVRAGTVPIDQYAIIKQLQRNPTEYDEKSLPTLPHVVVALRMTKNNIPFKVGDFVPHVIADAKTLTDEHMDALPNSCRAKEKLGARAFHPTEMTKQGSKVEVDIFYYLSHQLISPVVRLCEHIEDFSTQMMVDVMGLTGQYNVSSAASAKLAIDEPSYSSMFLQNGLEESFPHAEQFVVQCPSCRRQTVVDPHHAMKKYAAQLAEKKGQGFAPYSVFECTSQKDEGGTCGHAINPVVVLNNLMASVRQSIESYYKHLSQPPPEAILRDSSPEEWYAACNQKIREQLSFYRALFEAPRVTYDGLPRALYAARRYRLVDGGKKTFTSLMEINRKFGVQSTKKILAASKKSGRVSESLSVQDDMLAEIAAVENSAMGEDDAANDYRVHVVYGNDDELPELEDPLLDYVKKTYKAIAANYVDTNVMFFGMGAVRS